MILIHWKQDFYISVKCSNIENKEISIPISIMLTLIILISQERELKS